MNHRIILFGFFVCFLTVGFLQQLHCQQVVVNFAGTNTTTGLEQKLDSIQVKDLTRPFDTTLIGVQTLTIGALTGVDDADLQMPNRIILSNNFGNPFSDKTSFDVTVVGQTGQTGLTLEVFNILGRKIVGSTMHVETGTHRFRFDGNNLEPGIYLLTARVGTKLSSIKMLKMERGGNAGPQLAYEGMVDNAIAIPGSLRKAQVIGDDYRFVGFAKGFTPETISEKPERDTTFAFNLKPVNTAPQITSFTVDSNSKLTGDSVQYTISAKDAEGNLSKVWIDFDGDGVFDDSTSVSGSDANLSYKTVFKTPGSYLAKTLVKDAQGLTDEQSLASPVIVIKTNTAPTIVSFFADAHPKLTGDSVQYTITLKDAEGNLSKVWIDFDGDGLFDDSTSVSGSDAYLSYKTAFQTPGNYLAKARVMDAQGLMTEKNLSTPVIVTQANVPPVISLFVSDHDKRAKGLPVAYTVVVSDINGNLQSVKIDYDGDGVFDSTATVFTSDTLVFTNRYSKTGSFTPKVVATDAKALQDSAFLQKPVEVVDAIINPEVMVLSKDTLRSAVISYDTTGYSFLFHSDAPAQLGLHVGSILVSDSGFGFLRRITKLDTLSGSIRVTTVQATLTELFQEANIAFQKKLQPDTTHGLVGTGTRLPDYLLPPSQQFEYDFPDVVLYEFGGFQVKINGSVTFEPSLNVFIEIDNWQLKRAGCIFDFTVTPEIEGEADITLLKADLKKMLASLSIPPITVLVGPIPVVFIPELDVYAGIKGELSVALKSSVSISETFTAGMIYDSGTWSVIRDSTSHFEFKRPAFSVDASIRGYIEGDFYLSIYGVSGPYLTTSLFDELEIKSSNKPIAVGSVGLDVGGGFKMEVLGMTIDDYNVPEFFTIKFPVWNSDLLDMPEISSIDPTMITTGTEVTVTGKNFGDTRANNKVNFMGGSVAAGNLYSLVAIDYTSWSDTQIILHVPAGINTDGVLYVTVDDLGSNQIPFQLNQTPILTTTAVSNILPTTATSGGTITSDGGFPVTARGVCWSTAQNPTISDSKTSDGAGTGTFISNMTGLNPNTPYYVRAYATNSAGTGYGNEVMFTTTQGQEPVLTTTAVSNITQTTASSGGTVTSDGGFPVTARGVCWSVGPSPTISDSKTTNGVGTGTFTSNLTGLTSNTPYYVRAYATNSTGTGYGNEVTFTTQTGGGGGSVTIGSQVWMDKNLDVDKYRNGDPIPQVTDAGVWANLTTGAWCWYNNDPAMGAIYGKLYNWYAVNDPRGLAPAGWHVPTDAEWKTLEMSLGMTQAQADATGYRGTDEGGKMKETGTTHWTSPNTGADNSSGFTALPGGYRDYDGTFVNAGYLGLWWSSSEFSGSNAWNRYLLYDGAVVYRDSDNKYYGFSVRCVRD